MKKILFHEYPGYLKTDILPFEMPVMYSNDNYYNYILKNRTIYRKLINCDNLNYDSFSAQPLKFKIYVRDSKVRELSIVSPYSYLPILHYLKTNESLILSGFNSNSFSLRYPSKRISNYHSKRKISTKFYSISNIDKLEKKNGTHYVIKKFSRSYEFENSQYFLNLQYENGFFTKLDIKGCFDSIYTHSYKWIISDDFTVSRNIGKSKNYLGQLDKLLTNLNGKKTNGIPIGAEFFRLAAEVLLSHIDSKIKNSLREKSVVIKRFIDDYYVFSTNPDDLKFAEEQIEFNLGQFSLVLNDKKKETYSDFFVLNKWYIETNQIINQLDLYNISSINTQKHIMSIISQNKEQRATVVSYIVSVLVNKQQEKAAILKKICKHALPIALSDDKFKSLILKYLEMNELDFQEKYQKYITISDQKPTLQKEFIPEVLLNVTFEKKIFSVVSKILFYIKLAPKYINYLKLIHLLNDYILISKYSELDTISNSLINAISKNFDFNHLYEYKVECSNMLLIFESLNIHVSGETLSKIIADKNPLFMAVVYRYTTNLKICSDVSNEIKELVTEKVKYLISLNFHNSKRKLFMEKNIWYFILFNNCGNFANDRSFESIRVLTHNDCLLKKYLSDRLGFFNYEPIDNIDDLEILNKNIYFRSLVNINY